MKYFSNKVLDKKIKEEGGGGGETYTADEETLHLGDGNEFSISDSWKGKINLGVTAYGKIYFQPNANLSSLVEPIAAFDYLGSKKGLIFESVAESEVESSPAHLMLRNFGTVENPNYALYTPYAIISKGDQIVGSGTPGGGGGEGVDHIYKLEDVYGNYTTERVKTATGEDASDGQALVWNSGLSKWVAGTVQSGGGSVTSVGLSMPTGFSVSDSPVTSSGTIAVSFSNGYSLPTTAKQTNWDTAYGWGNHANAGYLLASTAQSTYLTQTLAATLYHPKGGDTASNTFKIGGATFTWHPESSAGAGDAYLELDTAFVTLGDQIVGSGTPGGGGGGGAGYLYELHDVADSLATPTSGMVLQYNGTEWVGVQASTIGGVTSVVGQTGAITAAQISAALNLGAAATYGIGSVASGNTGLVTGGSVYSAINSALSSVLKFVGVTTTEITDGSTTNPVIINGSSYTAVTGNVVLYGAKEYLWTGSAWEEMGDEASWALKTITITAGTGLTGGGTLEANRTISLSSATIASLALADSAYQKPAGGIPNSDLANSWVKVGTTQINLGGQQTSLAGLVNVTMSGKLTIGSAEIEWVAGTGGAPGYLKINSALLTDGDQIVGSGTPGGGGGGGAGFLYELGDVYSVNNAVARADGTEKQVGDVLQYLDSTKGWVAVAASSIGRIYSAGTGISISNANVISLNGSEYYSATTSRIANTVLAAPSGSNGVASFRKLVAADIPDLSGVYLPLSGGTLKSANYGGQLTIWRNSASGDAVIVYRNDGGLLGNIGISYDGKPYWTNDSGTTKWVFYHEDNANLSTVDWNTRSLYVNNRLYMRGGSLIEFDASDNTFRGLLGASSTNEPIWYDTTWHTIYHTGNLSPLTTSNYTSYALPLSAGSSYPLTGDLYLTAGKGIEASGGAGLLVYHPATNTWTGVSNTQWGVGATDSQGVIRSGNNNLLHYRNGTNYTIWDESNFRAGTEYVSITGTETITGTKTFSTTSYGAQITIKRNQSNYDAMIRFENATDGLLGYLGIRGSGTAASARLAYSPDGASATTYAIYHSGNSNLNTVSWAVNNLSLAGNINPTAKNSSNLGSASLNFSYAYANIVYPGTSNNLWFVSPNDIYFVNGSDTSGTKLGAWTSTGLCVGADTPDYKLHVAGDLGVTGGITMSYATTLGSLDSGGTRRSLLGTDSGGTYLAYGMSGAGVNTNICGNAIALLYGTSHTTGMSMSSAGIVRFNIPSFTNFQILRTASGGSAAVTYYPANQTTNYWAAGADPNSSTTSIAYRFFWYYNGAYKAYLTTDGTLVTTGDQVISSDINLKKNIKDIELTVEQIAQLPAVTFDWKDGRGSTFGTVAQGVLPIFPQAVRGNEGNYSVVYGQGGWVFGVKNARAIVDIQAHETEQDKEIRKLKARVRDLEKQLQTRS